MTDPSVRMVDVLLVEDDPGDVLMTREAFDEHVDNRLEVVAQERSRSEAPPGDRSDHVGRRRDVLRSYQLPATSCTPTPTSPSRWTSTASPRPSGRSTAVAR
jgi:hypothetical protein